MFRNRIAVWEYADRKGPPPPMTKGDYIEIPVHFDRWMQGARFGTVRRIVTINGQRYAKVRMDHPQVRRLLTIAEDNWPYCNLVRSFVPSPSPSP